MFDVKIRLISMLGLLTVVVLIGLIVEYRKVRVVPRRMGMVLAVAGIVLGTVLTLCAVLPENHVFGRVFFESATTKKVVALTFDDGHSLARAAAGACGTRPPVRFSRRAPWARGQARAASRQGMRV